MADLYESEKGHERLIEDLRAALCEKGLDIVEPLRLSAYNEVAPSHAVSEHRAEALALVVGNGRAIWQPFLDWLRQRLFAESAEAATIETLGANPVDEYVAACLLPALEATGTPYDVYWGQDLRPERMVVLQKAAQCTGAFAHDGRHSHLCYHATLGSWSSLRAMVIFDKIDGPTEVAPCYAHLPSEEVLLQLESLMREALGIQTTSSPTDHLTPAAADAWVRFRAFAGQSHCAVAFEKLHLRYLVTKDRRLLLDALEERDADLASACTRLRLELHGVLAGVAR